MLTTPQGKAFASTTFIINVTEAEQTIYNYEILLFLVPPPTITPAK